MSGLVAPFAPSYLIFDSSVPYSRFGDSFDSDTTLERVVRKDMLDVYKVMGGVQLIRAATRTVKGSSNFDYLSLVEGLPAADLQSIAFTTGDEPGSQYGMVRLDGYEVPLNENPGFEGTSGLPVGWEPNDANPTWSASVTTEPGSHGRCLKVENRNVLDYGPRTITGVASPVQPGKILSVDTRLKYRNAEWSYVSMEGYQPAQDKWAQLVVCPGFRSGTAGWETWRCSFVVPDGVTKIRPRLAAGWAKDTAKGPGITWFDDIRIAGLDESFYSELASSRQAPEISYKKISPEKYKVRVTGATEPFVLVFGEAYDPLWTAKLEDGRSVDPVPLYSLVNGFPVDAKGTYEVTIEYRPQTWFQLGLLVSVLAILASIAFMVASAGREHGWWVYLAPRARNIFGIRPPKETHEEVDPHKRSRYRALVQRIRDSL
jgi:hypothetical protein